MPDTPTQHPASTSDARKRAADLATPDWGSDLREPLDLYAIRARAEAARNEIDRMTSAVGGPGASWRWSIPANPERDSDLILAASLTDVPALLAEVERLERMWGKERDRATSALEEVMHLSERAETAEAERDAAREALARVEALVAPQWRTNLGGEHEHTTEAFAAGRDWMIDRIRAALAQPATDEATAKQGFVVRADEPRCWRSECRNGCGYPGACSEKPATDKGAGA